MFTSLEEILSKNTIGMIGLDQQLIIRALNSTAKSLLSVESDIVGLQVSASTPHEKYEKQILSLHSLLEAQNEKVLIQIQKGITEAHLFPFNSDKNSPYHYIITLKPTVPHSQEELHRLKLVTEEINDGYWDLKLKPNGEPTDEEYLSPSFKRMLGYEDHEMKNSPSSWMNLIDQNDLKIAIANLEKHIASNGSHAYSQPVKYRHRNGSDVYVICRGMALKNKSGEYTNMIGIHQDITKLVKRTKQLKEITSQLETFNQIITHDLNAPIRTVGEFLQLLEESTKNKLNNNELRYLEFTKQGVSRVQQLLASLFEYTKIAGREEVLTYFPVSQLKRNLEDMLHADLASKNAQLNWHFDRDYEIFGHFHQVSLILQNLIMNATRYISSERSPIIDVFVKEKGPCLEFTVSDNGVGIKAIHRDIIFNPFQRIKQDSPCEGLGMGLAIVKKLVEIHKGKIYAEPNEDVGSRFIFTLSHGVGQ